MRNAPEHVANIVDGESKDIPGYFVKIYSELYNSTDDAKQLRKLSADINKKINFTDFQDVEKITPDVVKEANKELNK